MVAGHVGDEAGGLEILVWNGRDREYRVRNTGMDTTSGPDSSEPWRQKNS